LGFLAYVRKNDTVPSKLRHFRTVGGAVEGEARRSFEMIVELRSRGFALTPALRAYVERRLAFALDRHLDRVARVRVVLFDVNGPKGGADKACRIDVRLRGGRVARATSVERDGYASIDRTAHRVARLVAREVARERTTLFQLDWLERTMARRQRELVDA
jgi:putative sigma-54 modulation protein